MTDKVALSSNPVPCQYAGYECEAVRQENERLRAELDKTTNHRLLQLTRLLDRVIGASTQDETAECPHGVQRGSCTICIPLKATAEHTK